MTWTSSKQWLHSQVQNWGKSAHLWVSCRLHCLWWPSPSLLWLKKIRPHLCLGKRKQALCVGHTWWSVWWSRTGHTCCASLEIILVYQLHLSPSFCLVVIVLDQLFLAAILFVVHRKVQLEKKKTESWTRYRGDFDHGLTWSRALI